jgi:hypothetical protein
MSNEIVELYSWVLGDEVSPFRLYDLDCLRLRDKLRSFHLLQVFPDPPKDSRYRASLWFVWDVSVGFTSSPTDSLAQVRPMNPSPMGRCHPVSVNSLFCRCLFLDIQP